MPKASAFHAIIKALRVRAALTILRIRKTQKNFWNRVPTASSAHGESPASPCAVGVNTFGGFPEISLGSGGCHA